jgi:serine/threonine protein kinase
MTAERWQRVKRIFQAAAELPPAERDTWITAEAAGDNELRREVARMLRHASGSGLLDTPAWEGLHMESDLEPGSQLGPYEIVAEAGAGGMGRVYKARDTRLGRMVAIKVLRAEFSHRLRIEGRAISALNHPHVCALYDIGDEEGLAYLVMEWVEGESLAACLARGPLPPDAVLRYGCEIAGALAAAHAQGIVHRDLKPANIMITASGAKVLDFGVARMAQDDETPDGTVIGTAAYMSPSQWNGSPADARSDIFALGLILSEMLTGTQPSREEPRPPENTPAELARLIEACLRPDSSARVQSMEEVQSALNRLRLVPVPTAAGRSIRPAWVAALALLAVGIGVARLELTRGSPGAKPSEVHVVAETSNPTPSAPVVRPAVIAKDAAPSAPKPKRAPTLPQEPALPPLLTVLSSDPGLKRDPNLSRDGTRVAYAWHQPGVAGYRICVRRVNSDAEPTCLTDGSTDDWGPAWSPDGRRIAFQRRTRDAGLYWVSASGGPEHLIARTARPEHDTLPQVSWSHDGKWIAAPDRASSKSTSIALFSVDSAEKRELTSNPYGTDHAPAFSPDGQALAYASCRQPANPCDIYTIALDRNLAAKASQKITDQGIYVRGLSWLPDGRSLVFAAARGWSQETWLWKMPLVPSGPAQRIELAGSSARHPSTALSGGLLAYTRIANWNLMLIRNFR